MKGMFITGAVVGLACAASAANLRTLFIVRMLSCASMCT